MKSINNILLWLALTSAMFIGWQNLSAQTWKVLKNSEKNLIENFENISHEKVITIKINDLINKYWREKTQELVREHSLIEINKYKKWEKYKPNAVLTKSAQNHADDMSKNDYFDHKSLDWKHVWDRVDSTNYNYKYLWENISNDNNISDVVMSYLHSTKWWHEEILEERYEDIWLWISKTDDDSSWESPVYYFVFNFAKEIKSKPPLDIVWLSK